MFDDLSAEELVAAATKAPPGPDLLTALAALDVGQLDPDTQVNLLVALERHVAWLSGMMQPVYAAVGPHAEAVARRRRRND